MKLFADKRKRGIYTLEKQHIYITRKIPNELLQPYQEQFHFSMWEKESEPVPREVLLEKVEHVTGILCLLTDQIDEEVFNKAKHLQLVANMAVGYDNIDVEAAKARQVIVTNTPDVLTETTADLTFALLMATARRIVEANEFIKKDEWKDWSPFLLAGSDIHHQTIGIVGMGRIGEAVARRAKGFGMNILYYNRSRKTEAEQELDATYVSFEKLLTEADFVVCLTPLTPATHQIFNKQAFEKMKQSAIFINASRGMTMDEQALYEALKAGEIKAAGLDVFATEPIRASHPLLELDNVVCLPHIGSASVATRENMIKLCLENLSSYFNGHGAKTPVE